MKLTNRLGLPEPLVEAIRNDGYHRGGADYSVTQLLEPPRKVWLERYYADDLEEDASDRIWSLLGQAVHTILERAASVNSLAEQRYAVELPIPGPVEGQGIRVSGQFDHMALDGAGLLQDYKTMSVWEYVRGIRKEREQQLNLLAFILGVNGIEVNALEAVCIFRDWSKTEQLRSGRDYPATQVVRVPIALWPREEQRDFLMLRVGIHEAERARGGFLTDCTDEDRWAKPTTYAVMKKGRKTAVRVLKSLKDAEDYALYNGLARTRYEGDDNTPHVEWLGGHYLMVRPGESVRCRHYCSVAEKCNQWTVLREQEKAAGEAEAA